MARRESCEFELQDIYQGTRFFGSERSHTKSISDLCKCDCLPTYDLNIYI